MLETGGISYSIGENNQTRALASLPWSDERHLYTVGTCNLSLLNQIVILEFIEEKNQIIKVGAYFTPNEITGIFPARNPQDLLAISAFDGNGRATLTLNQISPKEAEEVSKTEEQEELIDKCKFSFEERIKEQIHSVLWPEENENQCMTLDNKKIIVWDIQNSTPKSTFTFETSKKGECRVGKKDPHNAHLILFSDNNCVKTMDLRSSKVVHNIENAHSFPILDADYNSNKVYNIATTAQDFRLKFWDLRQNKMPLLVIEPSHSHWIYKVKYNHYHDQLILSSSSDTTAKLWRIVSVSSLSLMEFNSLNNSEESDDLIQTFPHNDSVYGMEWSAVEPWSFGSISYNGVFSINYVPSTEKYKILL